MNLSELSQSQLGTLGNMIVAAEEEIEIKIMKIQEEKAEWQEAIESRQKEIAGLQSKLLDPSTDEGDRAKLEENVQRLKGDIQAFKSHIARLNSELEEERAAISGKVPSSPSSGTPASPSVECQVLVECHGMLVTGLEASYLSLSHQCYGKGLISEGTYKSILELNLTNSEKTARLLLNVKQTIEQKQEMFEEFVNVLDELGACEHLVEALKKTKERLQVRTEQ